MKSLKEKILLLAFVTLSLSSEGYGMQPVEHRYACPTEFDWHFEGVNHDHQDKPYYVWSANLEDGWRASKTAIIRSTTTDRNKTPKIHSIEGSIMHGLPTYIFCMYDFNDPRDRQNERQIRQRVYNQHCTLHEVDPKEPYFTCH